MYKVWHCEVKPPVVLKTYEELKIYIQLMRTVVKETPRWEKVES